MFSEKDGVFRISVKIGSRVHEYTMQTGKEPTVDTGDVTTQVMANGRVAFVAEGGSKPTMAIMPTSGMESAKIRELCTNGKKKRICEVHYSCRRDGQSLVYTLTQAKLGEGGGVKASDADGVGGDKALKFLGKDLKQSINGGALKVVA